MDRIVKADLYRYNKFTGIKGFLKGLNTPGFRYMYFLRKAAGCGKYSINGIFYRLLVKRYSFKYGFQIPVSTQIGEGFYMAHFGMIIINHKVKIGKNCNVSHGVTIGETNRGKLKGCPTFGDKIWIGTGAVIVGKINIGSNVLIAPNTYINFDVPDNSIVTGSPATIIKNDNATEAYINNILE